MEQITIENLRPVRLTERGLKQLRKLAGDEAVAPIEEAWRAGMEIYLDEDDNFVFCPPGTMIRTDEINQA